MRLSRPTGDTGEPDPAVAAALAGYAAGQATEHATLLAIAATRLLVPVVAVPAEPDAGGAKKDGAKKDGAEKDGGAEKETEMALPTLIGNDGRKAVIAFTCTAALSRWRPGARPVPVPAGRLWPAAAAERADAVVIDVAGPVPFVVEGARLRALAAGDPPPPAYRDPDIRAAVAEVTADFALAPGGADAELTVTLKTTDIAQARAVADGIAARLAPRLRRGIAIRFAG